VEPLRSVLTEAQDNGFNWLNYRQKRRRPSPHRADDLCSRAVEQSDGRWSGLVDGRSRRGDVGLESHRPSASRPGPHRRSSPGPFTFKGLRLRAVERRMTRCARGRTLRTVNLRAGEKEWLAELPNKKQARPAADLLHAPSNRVPALFCPWPANVGTVGERHSAFQCPISKGPLAHGPWAKSGQVVDSSPTRCGVQDSIPNSRMAIFREQDQVSHFNATHCYGIFRSTPAE
jgi:hypothetical protein